jgi:23S rRNA pseudouridine1911/1915/1917 synthase
MKIDILYEDKDVVVLNKPAGLVVHSDGKTKEKTLADWVLKNYPETKEVGEPGRDAEGKTIYRPGIVHRLDRETSGVILIAKNQKSFESLKKQFQNHKVAKVYQAFVYGEIKHLEGVIDRPIGRSNKDFRMWSAQRGARGELRDAETHYKVLDKGLGYSFVEVAPKTGRTHQIRVHFKAISYPLVADKMYSSTTENKLGFKRLALHSLEVTFKDLKGKTHTVLAPYPVDFKKAMKVLSQ